MTGLEWHDENELVRKLDVVEAVLNLADTIDDVVDVIMGVPTYTASDSNKCYKCRWWNWSHGCQSKYKCKYEPLKGADDEKPMQGM